MEKLHNWFFNWKGLRIWPCCIFDYGLPLNNGIFWCIYQLRWSITHANHLYKSHCMVFSWLRLSKMGWKIIPSHMDLALSVSYPMWLSCNPVISIALQVLRVVVPRWEIKGKNFVAAQTNFSSSMFVHHLSILCAIYISFSLMWRSYGGIWGVHQGGKRGGEEDKTFWFRDCRQCEWRRRKKGSAFLRLMLIWFQSGCLWWRLSSVKPPSHLLFPICPLSVFPSIPCLTELRDKQNNVEQQRQNRREWCTAALTISVNPHNDCDSYWCRSHHFVQSLIPDSLPGSVVVPARQDSLWPFFIGEKVRTKKGHARPALTCVSCPFPFPHTHHNTHTHQLKIKSKIKAPKDHWKQTRPDSWY